MRLKLFACSPIRTPEDRHDITHQCDLALLCETAGEFKQIAADGIIIFTRTGIQPAFPYWREMHVYRNGDDFIESVDVAVFGDQSSKLHAKGQVVVFLDFNLSCFGGRVPKFQAE